MNQSSDAAEQLVRMTLNGVETVAKISGTGAKQVSVLLYAALQEQGKTKGKIRLNNMLKSGKELKVFAVRDGELQKFCTEAKKYGVLYCILKDKNSNDGKRESLEFTVSYLRWIFIGAPVIMLANGFACGIIYYFVVLIIQHSKKN